MSKKLWLGLAFTFVASIANAQAATLSYDFVDKLPAVVATYTQKITWDGVVITAPTVCTALGTAGTTCSVVIPTVTSGNHTAIVDVTLDGNVVRATKVFNTTNMPGTPGGFKLIITFVVP